MRKTNVADITNKITAGDCLKIMRQIPSESVDLLVTDPPYNVSQDGKVDCGLYKDDNGQERYARVLKDFGEWDKFTPQDFWAFTEAWLNQAVRIMKPNAWGYIFFTAGKIGMLHKLYRDLGLFRKNTLTWCKINPAPAIRQDNWVSATEILSVFCKGRVGIKNFLGQREMRNYIVTPSKTVYGESRHPTEKPVEVVSRLIRASSSKNEIVLDPFLGSGTTAIAAIGLGRRFIGIEQDVKYIEMAKKRIKKHFNY